MSETSASSHLRWAYMDHWRVETPQGPVSQYTSVAHFDRFLKQIAAVGFEAIETFDFHLGVMRELCGSLEKCRDFLQERGVGCHHEFFCGIRSAAEIEKFYEWTDPRYVFFYCDTAQHVIAGVDPLAKA